MGLPGIFELGRAMNKRSKKTLLRGCLAAALILFGPSTTYAQATPQRVVSINVCTDQLAMLLASEAQLRSVSFMAVDPFLSTMADQASRLPLNDAQVEEVILMKPDLVLASTFSSRTTVELLRELGVRVEEFEPARDFEDIRLQIARMGNLLGQPERAQAEIESMEAALAEIDRPSSDLSVALYYANGYTSGPGTLIDAVVRQAGLKNIAERAGVRGSTRMPLEMLIMEKPDIILSSSRERGPALAFENFEHPAMHALENQARIVSIDDNLTVCGGPFTVKAVEQLAGAARE